MMEDISQELATNNYYDEKTGEYNMKAISGTLSMVIWGCIVAKAKAGSVAAVSKDHATVSTQYKNAAILVGLIALATFAQWKFESSYESVKTVDTPKSNGRNLKATMYESNKKNVEVIDHDKVLEDAISQWRSNVEVKSTSNKKTLQT